MNPRDVELVEIELHRVHSPLGSSFRTSAGVVETREALIIRLHANIGGFDVTGWGEAAPLPGWSTDTLSRARFELGRLRDMIFGGACPDLWAGLSSLQSPSARFAFSTALFDAAAHARRKPLRCLLDPDAPHEVPVNATLGISDSETAAARAREAVAAGFSTLKLKVGDAEDVARVSAVRAAAPHAVLRLDANGAWDLDMARRRIEAFAAHDISYIEQPVARPQLAELRRVSPIRIAADESCTPLEDVAQLIESEAADVLIFKPSQLGAWGEIIDAVNLATAAGIDVVFTSALDFAVARAAVAQVAAAMLPGVVCGLATGRHPLDVTSGEDPIAKGRLLLGSGNGLGIRVRLPGDAV